MLDTLYWDLPRLFDEIKTALRKAASGGGELDGVGVDTWGVDFGLVGRGDDLLGNPVHYRDARTERHARGGVPARPPRADLRDHRPAVPAVQHALSAPALSDGPGRRCFEVAETLLMMPDLFGWLLTGRRAGERTDASTTQLLDPRTGTWSDELCRGLELPRAILPDLIEPGTRAGAAPKVGRRGDRALPPRDRDRTGHARHRQRRGRRAGRRHRHRRRSSSPPDWCYLSSGTWSLLGVEVPHPVINAETMRYNFTNEGGVAGTTRLLKNIMGLWLVQESRRTWARTGREWAYEELIARAQVAPPFTALVDPDDATFLAPVTCRPGWPPSARGPVSNCRETRGRWSAAAWRAWLSSTAGRSSGSKRSSARRSSTIHVVGGGSKNALLCQFTADACGRPVHAGPVEATAIGNILMQAIGRRQARLDRRASRRGRPLVPGHHL